MATRTALSRVWITFETLIRNTRSDGRYGQARVSDRVLDGSKIETGYGADEANRAKLRTISLASGIPQDFDLASQGNDNLQQDIETTEVSVLIIKHNGDAGTLAIEPTPSAPLPWAPTLSVANGGALKPGGVFFMYQEADDGFPVEAGAASIRLTAIGAEIEVQLFNLARDEEISDDSSSSTSVSSLSSLSSSSTT
jgi:hypothetical protein